MYHSWSDPLCWCWAAQGPLRGPVYGRAAHQGHGWPLQAHHTWQVQCRSHQSDGTAAASQPSAAANGVPDPGILCAAEACSWRITHSSRCCALFQGDCAADHQGNTAQGRLSLLCVATFVVSCLVLSHHLFQRTAKPGTSRQLRPC